jgi:hypothetical protein
LRLMVTGGKETPVSIKEATLHGTSLLMCIVGEDYIIATGATVVNLLVVIVTMQ